MNRITQTNKIGPRDDTYASPSTAETARLQPAVAPPRLLVSLATYNEAENLRDLVARRSASSPRTPPILVIDDNSPDGTGRLADELRATLPDVHVIHRPGKLGLGTAILDGHEVRHRPRLRLLPQPRRRLQPPAPVHPRDPRRDGATTT